MIVKSNVNAPSHTGRKGGGIYLMKAIVIEVGRGRRGAAQVKYGGVLLAAACCCND